MNIGDLVKYSQGWEVGTGIIVGFDMDDDPIVRDNRSGVVAASWRKKVEIIGKSA